jgi:hypothetical protein
VLSASVIRAIRRDGATYQKTIMFITDLVLHKFTFYLFTVIIHRLFSDTVLTT